jgi:hypothetical protein
MAVTPFSSATKALTAEVILFMMNLHMVVDENNPGVRAGGTLPGLLLCCGVAFPVPVSSLYGLMPYGKLTVSKLSMWN